MSNDLNNCNFIGRLGKDPEIKYTASGKAIANFSLANGKSWKDKQTGEKKESTTWVPMVAYEQLAEIIGKYLTKGSQVFISGEFNVRKWQDKDGNDRYTTEIVVKSMQMLGDKKDSQSVQSNPAKKQLTPVSNDGDDFGDETIPF